MNRSFLDSDEEIEETPATTASSSSIISLVPPPDAADNTVVDPATGAEEPFIFAAATTSLAKESMAETVRQSGLAWSAGIAFFASVVFMMIIGWGADLLFGSSPWGIVGGIVLGSIIGFVQFFRITSRIFNPNREMDSGRILVTRDDDKDKQS